MRREIVEDNIIFMKHFMRITTWGLRGRKASPFRAGRRSDWLSLLFGLLFQFFCRFCSFFGWVVSVPPTPFRDFLYINWPREGIR
ncbi:MAG: hypothetical protein RXQ96_03255 [Thermocladium sp.]